MTKTSSFDAVVEFCDRVKEDPLSVLLCTEDISVSAFLRIIDDHTFA